MKNALLIIFAFLLVVKINAQSSNAIFYSENGERFTVIMNGVKQNVSPETNVKVTGLNAPNYQVKIIFDDQNLGSFDKNIYFVTMGNEYTYAITKNKKGEYKLAYRSDVPVAQAPPTSPTQTNVVYQQTPPPNQGTVTHSQTTTTTYQSGNAQPQGGVSLGINVNDGNEGVNFNMNVNPGNVNMNMNSNVQTTTSYSTTTTTTTSGYDNNDNPPPPPPPPAYNLPGYNGPIGCPYPMSPNDFESAKQSISSKSFEDSKLTIAKQIINTNCLLTTQVKQIMLLFSFEETRLDFAKYAYSRTYDIGNYFKLNDAFTFESSIDELNNYINAQH